MFRPSPEKLLKAPRGNSPFIFCSLLLPLRGNARGETPTCLGLAKAQTHARKKTDEDKIMWTLEVAVVHALAFNGHTLKDLSSNKLV